MFKWLGEHWSQVTTAIVALYGAILSTLNSLSRRAEKKRKLALKMSGGWIPNGIDPIKRLLLIEVANPGYRPVTVETPYVRLPKEENLIVPIPELGDKFPYELREGKKCSLWIDEATVRQTLIEKGYVGKVKLRAQVSDQTGNRYEAKDLYVFDLGVQS